MAPLLLRTYISASSVRASQDWNHLPQLNFPTPPHEEPGLLETKTVNTK